MAFLTRLKYHTLRYRGEISYGSWIIGILMLLVVIAFPKDNSVIVEYVGILSEVGLDQLLANIDVNAPAWLFWVSLMTSAYLYIVSAIIAVRIGSKLFPTESSSALELIASSPEKSRRFYLENILAAVIALILVLLPSFLILAGYSLTQNAADILPRLAALFTLSLTVAIFFVAFSSLFSVFRFSQSTGSKIGYIYLFLGFMIDLGAGASPEYADLANISVNSYVAPSAGLLTGDHHWMEMVVVLLIAMLFFAISYLRIASPDYVEKITTDKSRFSLGFVPQFSPRRRLASHYPLLFDQLRTDRSYMIIWTAVVDIAMFYVVTLYNFALKDDPAVLASLTANFGSILDIFTFGYDVPATYTGFLSFEVFGLAWLYFGVFVLIPAINIANRDQSKDRQDMIWSNSISPEQVIIQRTLSILIYFTVLFWLSFLVVLGSSQLYGLPLDSRVLLSLFIIGQIHYTAITFLLIGITLFFPIRDGKKWALRFYLVSILIMVVSFLISSVDFLKYFSVIYSYNTVGIVLEKTDLQLQYLYAGILLVGSVILYIIGLKYRYRHQDLIA